MSKGLITLIVTLVAALLGGLVFVLPASAQEEDGFRETFDDPTLHGWEHSRDAAVVDGVLRMEPGSFALHFGDWSEITLTVMVRRSAGSGATVGYYFRDEGTYGVALHEGFVVVEKEQNQQRSELAGAEVEAFPQDTWVTLMVVVSGGQHQVYADDELVLTATDSEPLETGAVILHAFGEGMVEFDDLDVRGTPGEPPPGEGFPPGEEMPPDEEPPPGEEMPPGEQVVPGGGGAPGTGGAPGGTSGTGSIVDEFFATQASNRDLGSFAINLALAVACAYVLSLVYIHWGASLTNRRKFAANFYLLTATTTFIILVVRSSVALSLGLVGALSIVRFRTAVKEAEELAYLFLAIGVGIGLGDDQKLVTLVALAVVVVAAGLLKLFRRAQADVNLHLTVASHNPARLELDQIMQALKPHTAKLKLLRFDENAQTVEAAFLVEFRRVDNLNDARAALRALSEGVEITFLDNKGIW
jgi:uncharacterized membrane protein YhiD involved in acid resistance